MTEAPTIDRNREASRIIRQWSRLARKRLARIHRYLLEEDYEELLSDCYLAIWEAWTTYNPRRGTFKAYVWRAMSGKVSNFHQRRRRARCGSAPIEDAPPTDGRDIEARQDMALSLEAAIEAGRLTPRQVEMVEMARAGYREAETAREWGRTRERVRQIGEEIRKIVSSPCKKKGRVTIS
jgi:RNA polymerase sigma factor (sigma-70 family)